MRHIPCLLTALLCLGICQAGFSDDAAPTVKLQYAPKIADIEVSTFSGKITDVMLAGLSYPEAGQAAARVKREIVQLDLEKGTFTVRLTVADTSSQMAGQDREVAPKTVDVVFTRRGETVKPEDAKDAKPLDDVGGMIQGGLPLDALAQMAIALVFPEEPVAVGGEWTSEGAADLPLMGTTQVKSTTKLAKLEGNKAYLETTMSADVPPFEAESPMVGTVKVVSGKVSAEKIERQFDVARSVMVLARGKLRIEMKADIGFGEVPVEATVQFELKPVEKPAPQPAP